MVTTHACHQARHDDCGGLVAQVLNDRQLLVSSCGCLCHAGSASDDALEQLLEQEGRRHD